MLVHPRSLALAAVLGLGVALPASADTPTRSWTVLETPHFAVHYYAGEEQTARRVAAAAENHLPRLAHDFGITVTETIPIVVSRSNFFNGSAEPLKDRIQIDPVLAASSEIGTERFVAHELTHVVTFMALQSDLPITRLQNLGTLPTWFLEGLAQYEGEYWYHSNDEMLRLSTLQHAMLTPSERDNFPLLGVEGGAAGYNEGFSLTRYLFDTYGKAKIAELFKVLRAGEEGSFPKALEKVFGKPFAELQTAWQTDLRKRYALQVAHVDEELAGSRRLVASVAHDVNVQPRLSPDGHRLAFLSSRHQDGYIYLRGHVMGGLTLNLAHPDGSGVQELKVARGRVVNYAWSPDGSQIVVAAITSDKEGDPGFDLFLYDLKTAKAQRLTEEGDATYPAWRPGSREITYLRTLDGSTHLQAYDLDASRSHPVSEVVLGDRHARDLTWSPDGRMLAMALYATGEGARLATFEPATGRLRTWTDGPPEVSDQAPCWAPDGHSLVFSSDRDGMQNLYRLTLDHEPVLSQLTHVYTGASDPAFSSGGRLDYVASRAVGREIRQAAPPPGEPISYRLPAQTAPGIQLADATPALPNHALPDTWSTHGYASTMTNDLIMPQISSDERGSQLGVVTMYSDILEQQQLGLDVRFGLMSQRFSYAASYVNHMQPTLWGVTLFDTPTVGITTQLDPARLYDSLYWERSQGVSLGAQRSIGGGQTLSVSVGLANMGVLQPPPNAGETRSGRQQTVTLGWSESHVKSTDDEDLNPSKGYQAAASFTLSDRLFGSDFNFSQLVIQGARYLPIFPEWRHNLAWSYEFAMNQGQAFPLFLGGVQGGGPIVPLRGYNVGSFAGDRLAAMGLDYTFPLSRRMDLTLGPIYLHQIYGSAFVEAGDAWKAGESFTPHPTAGAELRIKTAFMSRQVVVFRVGVARRLTPDGTWGMYVTF